MIDPLAPLRTFWNQRYGEEAYAYGTAPNDFLVRCLQRLRTLPAAASVLCLADGEGRNGVWLAEQGFVVTSVDVADAGQRKARELAARKGVEILSQQADVTTMELGERRWGAIVSIFLHLPAADRRALHRRCAAAVQAFAQRQPMRSLGWPACAIGSAGCADPLAVRTTEMTIR